MKSSTILWIALVLVIVWLVWAKRSKSANASASPAVAEPAPVDAYLGLRNMMLQGSRASFGLPSAANSAQPWGVLMDWGRPSGTVTVACLSDGNASVYFSGGGGYIGGGQSHEEIRTAARKMVSIAGEFQSQMQSTKTYPLPKTGEISFYVLTDSGVFTVSASAEALQSGQSPFSPLANSAQYVITQYRLMQNGK